MRLILLTALAMCAFAANSVLNRMAVGQGLIDPVGFALVRVCAGAIALLVIVILRQLVAGRAAWPGWADRVQGVLGLITYLTGFSLAYRRLDAGMGALILFGVVQITMFAGALTAREVIPARRWLGAGLAFGGLMLLLWPGGTMQASLPHAGLMAGAGIGWGIYSLAGRRARDPVAATAANFGLAVPVMLCLLPWVPLTATPGGVWLAVLSGAVTSGLGYALWYSLVPRLGAARAGVAQLTVPVIAAAGGLALLGETVGWRFIAATTLVLLGVALASLQGVQAKVGQR